MIIVTEKVVRRTLQGREKEVIDIVAETYRAHDFGATSLPHSTFLRFPNDPSNRIIGLPAYIGGSQAVSGFKWVSSFPANLRRGIPRASAVIVLNEMSTGRPVALLEASHISAQRTAASAALAASLLVQSDPSGVGLVGIGPINREVIKYLKVAFPHLTDVGILDQDRARGQEFQRWAAPMGWHIREMQRVEDVLATFSLVSFATSAITPYSTLHTAAANSTVLHISLRDLMPDAIASAQNVVDDADHVNRAQTSVHLLSQRTGDTAFIDASLGSLLNGRTAWQRTPDRPVVFSPFGLGVLDLALAQFVVAEALKSGSALHLDDFFDI